MALIPDLKTPFGELYELALRDIEPELQGTLAAATPSKKVVVLQCIYYAHMFLVLREHALMRRLKLERRRKKKLMATFAGGADRQDAYLSRRQELLKGMGLDKVPTTEGDQMAQMDGMIAQLEATISNGGKDVTVGIIGCGSVGIQLLKLLLQCGTFTPDRILVSTRRPDELLQYQARGVHCSYDNGHVASKCDFLFLACLPTHVNRVAQDILGGPGLRPQLVVCSTLLGVASEKIVQMLGVACVLRPILNASLLAKQCASGVSYQFDKMHAMVDLAADAIADDKQNIYLLLFALAEWCQSLELDMGEARKIALFCLVGDPKENRDLEPLEQFRRRFLWTLRRIPELMEDESVAQELANVHMESEDKLPPIAGGGAYL